MTRSVAAIVILLIAQIAGAQQEAQYVPLISVAAARRGVLEPANPHATEALPVETCDSVDITVKSDTAIAVEIVTPTGDRITSAAASALGATFVQWDYITDDGDPVWQVVIEHSPSGGVAGGVYSVEIAAAAPLSTPSSYAVTWLPKSGIEAAISVGRSHVFLGEEGIGITAFLFDGDEPVRQATLDTKVLLLAEAAPELAGTVDLRDDGSGVDLVASDGSFTGGFAPTVEGEYEVVSTVRGVDGSGSPFEKALSTRFSVSNRNVAKLTGDYSFEKNLDVVGRVGSLSLRIGVRAAAERRRFDVGATLKNDDGLMRSVHVVDEIRGESTAVIRVYPQHLEELGGSGQYHLVAVELEELTGDKAIRRDEARGELLVIPAVSNSELQKGDPKLTSNGFTTTTVDRDKDGLFETLLVYVPVSIPRTGIYLVQGVLETPSPSRKKAATSRTTPHLTEAPQLVELRFDGCELAASGVTAPLKLRSFFVSRKDTGGPATDAALSTDVSGDVSYGSRDFECLCVGDCDGNASVTVPELITAVNIMQGLQSTETCLAFDRNLDSALTVDELVSGVKSALDGCKTGELVGAGNGAMFSMWSGSGYRGETVSFPIVVNEEAVEGVAGASFEFTYPVNVLSVPTCLREETVPGEYKFSSSSAAGRVKFSYVDSAFHYPAPTFAEGVLAVCEAQVRTDAPIGTHPLSVQVAATTDEFGNKRPNLSVIGGAVQVKSSSSSGGGCTALRGARERPLELPMVIGFGFLVWLFGKRRRSVLGLFLLAFVCSVAASDARAASDAASETRATTVHGKWTRSESGGSLEWRRIKPGKRALLPGGRRGATENEAAPGTVADPAVTGDGNQAEGEGDKTAGRRWYLNNIRAEHGGIGGDVAICGASFLSVGTFHLNVNKGGRITGQLRGRDTRVVAVLEGGLADRRIDGKFTATNGEKGKWSWPLPENMSAEDLERLLQALETNNASTR